MPHCLQCSYYRSYKKLCKLHNCEREPNYECDEGDFEGVYASENVMCQSCQHYDDRYCRYHHAKAVDVSTCYAFGESYALQEEREQKEREQRERDWKEIGGLLDGMSSPGADKEKYSPRRSRSAPNELTGSDKFGIALFLSGFLLFDNLRFFYVHDRVIFFKLVFLAATYLVYFFIKKARIVMIIIWILMAVFALDIFKCAFTLTPRETMRSLRISETPYDAKRLQAERPAFGIAGRLPGRGNRTHGNQGLTGGRGVQNSSRVFSGAADPAAMETGEPAWRHRQI